jgi:adenine-specific DNA-methyltransferase
MQNLQTELIDLLKHEDNLVIDGHLNKNKIVELALKVEPQLISLLIKNDTFKKHFFQEVANVLVFDKIKFQRFVNNKSFLPDSYTAFKNKIGLITNDDDLDNFISTSNDVVLAWPHKDCVLEGGQTKEDQKRNEIFWNETLAPDSVDRLLDAKAFTNFKMFDKEGVHKVTELKGNENLIIKGNNLLALTSILKTHRSKIKLIYIDPPFNTGNDSFKYNDNFNHSTWLTFMKNRLLIAKELLKSDGFIFIQCDYNEDAYLKVLMDEIFGSELYVSTITVRSNSISGNKTQHKDKTILKNKDSIIVYKKSNQILINPQYSVKNEWDTHYNSILLKDSEGKYEIKSLKDVLVIEGIIEKNYTINSNSVNESKFYKFIFNNRDKIFRGVNSIPKELEDLSLKNKDSVVFIENDGEKMFAYNGNRLSFLSKVFKIIDGKEKMAQLLGDLWVDIDFQNTQNEGGGVSFTNGKKPEALIKRIIDMTTSEGDFVLDYHLGSGTTAAVANKMGRKYIGIEQMDYIETIAIERLKKGIHGEQGGISKAVNWQGGGSFVYAELMQYNQRYFDIIQVAENKEQLINVWNEMQNIAFLSYQFDKKTFNERLEAFKTAPIEDMKQYLIEVLDKNQLYVNYSEINDETFKVSQEDKELNKQFYSKK